MNTPKGNGHGIRKYAACGHEARCRCGCQDIIKESGYCPTCVWDGKAKQAAEKPKQVLVDFDGVLHKYSKKWHDGTIYDGPVEGAKEGMGKMKKNGYRLVIFSARAQHPEQVKDMEAWLKKHEIPYDEIYVGEGKPPHELIIDDNAVRFEGDWREMKKEICGHLPKTSAELESDELDDLLVRHMHKVVLAG